MEANRHHVRYQVLEPKRRLRTRHRKARDFLRQRDYEGVVKPHVGFQSALRPRPSEGIRDFPTRRRICARTWRIRVFHEPQNGRYVPSTDLRRIDHNRVTMKTVRIALALSQFLAVAVLYFQR